MSTRGRFARAVFAAVTVCASAYPVCAAFVGYHPGDIIVADRTSDSDAESSDTAQLFRVDPVTGKADLLVTGGLLIDPFDVTFATNGDLLVVDAKAFGSGGVVRINHTTGHQTKVAGGSAFNSPQGIAIDKIGKLFVANDDNGTVITVDLASGKTHPLADGFSQPEKLALDANGNLLMVDFGGGGDLDNPQNASVYRINPGTGAHALVSNDDILTNAAGIAVRKDGTIVVPNVNGSGIVGINPTTGAQRTLVSNISDSFDIALLNDAEALVFSSSNELTRVNLDSGSARVIRQTAFTEPLGLAIVPDGANAIPLPRAAWAGLSGFAMIAILGAYRARRRNTPPTPM